MRMIAAFLFATILVAHAEPAKAAAWCAWSDAYTYNCGFHTLAQCRATIFGDSRAYCAPNAGYAEERRTPPSRVAISRTTPRIFQAAAFMIVAPAYLDDAEPSNKA